jgi:hypothetical protein
VNEFVLRVILSATNFPGEAVPKRRLTTVRGPGDTRCDCGNGRLFFFDFISYLSAHRGTNLSNGQSTPLLLLGVAIVLFPLLLFCGALLMLVVPPLLLWVLMLGVRLQRPSATVRAHLRRTHLVVLPVALL